MSSWIRRLVRFVGGLWNPQLPPLGSDNDPVNVVPAERLPRVTTGGMGVVAMVGDYDRSRLAVTNDEITLFESTGASVTAECGHLSRKSLVFDVYGVKVTGDGRRRCADCGKEELGKIAIRCALCGLPILPGDPVSIYDVGGADIIDDIAHRVGESVLGCNRWDCCTPGAFAGHWGGPEKGFISAFK
jgi:hypothetical protein